MPVPKRPPIMRRRRVTVWIVEFRCEWCGQWFEPSCRWQRFCRRSHQVNANVERARLGIPPERIRSVRWIDGRRVDLEPSLAAARDGEIAWVRQHGERAWAEPVPKRLLRSPAPPARRVGARGKGAESGGEA